MYESPSSWDAVKGFFMFVLVVSLPVTFVLLAFTIYNFSSYQQSVNIDFAGAFTLLKWNFPIVSKNANFTESLPMSNPWNYTLTLFVFYDKSLLTVKGNIKNGITTIQAYGSFTFDFLATTKMNLFNETSITVKGVRL